MEPTDSRLAALYDTDNPPGDDHTYFRQLAGDLDATKIVDLGCGTGLLTVTLATDHRRVIGIDPDAGLLDVARNRSGAQRVRWILGDSSAIDARDVDLVLMTGNVAQHIGPADWQRSLGDIARCLRRGGTLSFETRNPAIEAWRDWDSAATKTQRATASGSLTEWMTVTEPDATGTLVIEAHNVWDATGETVVVRQPLTFRDLPQITADLSLAGMSIAEVRGGWHREPLKASSPLLVIEARKT